MSRPSRDAKSGKGDVDEAADGRLGRKGAGGREGVEAVARQFVGVDVVAHGAARRCVGDEVANESVKVHLGVRDVRVSVHECGDASVGMTAGFVEDRGVRLEDGLEPFPGWTW